MSSIPKVNKPKKPADYGPVSVLPTLLKVYESVILHQMTLHITIISQDTENHLTLSTLFKNY